MKIPTAFSKHIKYRIRGGVCLKDRTGKRWRVEVVKEGTSVFFQGGWERFVANSGLKTGDFLVFGLDRSPDLTVLVFDQSTCDKDEAFRRTSCGTVKEEPSDDEPPLKTDDDDVSSRMRLGFRSPLRRVATEEEKAQALELALSFCSDNPFGIAVMTECNVYCSFYMVVPSTLVEHLPRATSKMRLLDPTGKSWNVMYVYGKSGGGFSAGWGFFADAHNLEKDDVVVFELVGKLEVKVHIYRVVEETPLLCLELSSS
ncbi:B3 domain-containing protein Os11g0197600-like isoform X2 [Wolffia australiana]